ncbi:hypothetical protein SLA2020_244340 [Shorea laevis]
MTTQSNFSLLFLSVSLLLLPLTCVGQEEGWQPIEDLNDPRVMEIAKFAVSEFDNQSQTYLKLNRILKGEQRQQVISIVQYRLILAVEVGVQTKNYEATVWETDDLSKKLISFIPINT